MKLYELTDAYKQLKETLELEEIDAEVFKDTADSIQDAFETKVENIAALVQELKAEEDAVYTEVQRLNERKKAISKNIERLKDYVASNMQAMNVKKVKGNLFTVSFRKSSKVVVTDIERVPDEFIKTTVEPRKTEIKNYLKDNPLCEWAHIEESESLNIR